VRAVKRNVIQQGWEQFSLYLPVVLMGLLALGSWWLVRNAPMPLLPAIERPPAHQPDYFMKSFSVKSFDATGRLQSEVQGDEARHYPDTDTLEIDKARMRSVAPTGRLTLATADRALTNADASEVQLFGNAIVTREPLPAKPGEAAQPRLEFRGEFLHAYTNTERVRSDKPVTLTRGNDRFTADSMDYDNLDQVVQLQGRVRGVLQPGKAASSR
jgi:lipopolysaccharide export system protein LptC